MIPAIEAGFVESVHSFGSELGMEAYIAARPDVFFTGPDGSMRSNRAFCQAAGHYACDMFIGSTLQIDLAGNSSTATLGRIAGFGGASNMGADTRGRRHASPAWLRAGKEAQGERNVMPRGKKLVVQMVETFREHMQPTFVERLDAWELAQSANMALPPVMICDVVVMSEEGRLGLAGPEVIETAQGVEEFDSQDRALVWRTVGGKHRYLLGDATFLVEEDLAAFRQAALAGCQRRLPFQWHARRCLLCAAGCRDPGDEPARHGSGHQDTASEVRGAEQELSGVRSRGEQLPENGSPCGPVGRGDLAGRLAAALREASSGDRRRELGEQRGGRRQARAVSRRVREDAIT